MRGAGVEPRHVEIQVQTVELVRRARPTVTVLTDTHQIPQSPIDPPVAEARGGERRFSRFYFVSCNTLSTLKLNFENGSGSIRKQTYRKRSRRGRTDARSDRRRIGRRTHRPGGATADSAAETPRTRSTDERIRICGPYPGAGGEKPAAADADRDGVLRNGDPGAGDAQYFRKSGLVYFLYAVSGRDFAGTAR